MTDLLAIAGVSKSFGHVQANHDVTFTVRRGEVHALLGENGAGKSTLVKNLYGVHQPDSGTIHVNGQSVTIDSPSRARELGIGLVFQDMRLIPALTVWENIALHLGDTAVLKPSEIKNRISEASSRWGLPVEPDARLEHLSVGEWQRVELLKVLLAGAELLILDEPTSVLTPSEADALFEVVEHLRSAGAGIVIITHKLREVRQIADRVTVLRGGRVVLADTDVDTIDDPTLVEAMVGRGVIPLPDQRRPVDLHHRPVLECVAVTTCRPDGSVALDTVDLAVRPGEILGVAGVAGNGQAELVDVLTGVIRPDSGDVLVADKVETGGNPGGFRRHGVLSVVPDPVRQFVAPGLTVAAHAALWEVAQGEQPTFDIPGAAERFRQRAQTVGLPVPTTDRIVETLSGGNIQRVVLTLALSSVGKALVVSYPTRGLDITTAQETRQALLDARERGLGIVLVSEDLDELIELSDRIAVLHHGSIVGVLDQADADRHALGNLMTRTAVHA